MSKVKTGPSHWPISVLSIIASFVNMLLPLVLVRMITPAEMGEFKVFFLYIMILPAFSFTTGVINGLYYWAGRAEKRDRAIHISSLIVLTIALTLLGLSTLLRGPISAGLHWPVWETMAFAVAVFGQIGSTFFEEAAIATGRIWTGAVFNSVFELLRTLAVIGVAYYFRSLPAIFWTHVGIQLVKTVLGYSIGAFQGLVKFRWDLDDFRAVWGYAFPVSLAWALGVFINYADQIILSMQLSPELFALYSIGCLSVPPLTILEYSVARVLIPQLSSAFAEQNMARAIVLYRSAVEELSLLLIPAVAGMFVFAEPIMQLLFTNKFAGASRVLEVYAFSYLTLAIPHDSVPRARGQAYWIMGNFLSFSVISLSLCFVLIHFFGIPGALAGVLITRALMKIYGAYYIHKSTGWKYRDFLPTGAILLYTGTSVGLGILSVLARPLFGPHNLHWLFVCGPVFTLIYFAVVLGMRRKTRPVPESGRVLMLTQYLGIGGLERMILNLSIELQAAGQWIPQVFVFDHPRDSTKDENLLTSFEAKKIPVETFSKDGGFSFAAVRMIARRCREGSINVIHSHDLGALIYAVGAKWLRLGGVRIVHTQHSFVHLARKKRHAYYERFFTLFADELAVVSEESADIYPTVGVPRSRIEVVTNGVSFPTEQAPGREARIAARLKLAQASSRGSGLPLERLAGSHWILYMARLHARKGQDHAVKLWEALPAETRKTTVIAFVGAETLKGELGKLEDLIAAAPDRERLVYFGSTHDPQAWLQSADAFLSCSEFEGMPLGPLEAAGAGLPFLLSDIPGHALLKEFGRLYPLDKPELGARQLAQVCSELAGDETALRNRLWAKAKPLRESYSIAAMARHYEALYRRNRVDYHFRAHAPGTGTSSDQTHG